MSGELLQFSLRNINGNEAEFHYNIGYSDIFTGSESCNNRYYLRDKI